MTKRPFTERARRPDRGIAKRCSRKGHAVSPHPSEQTPPVVTRVRGVSGGGVAATAPTLQLPLSGGASSSVRPLRRDACAMSEMARHPSSAAMWCSEGRSADCHRPTAGDEIVALDPRPGGRWPKTPAAGGGELPDLSALLIPHLPVGLPRRAMRRGLFAGPTRPFCERTLG